MNSNDINKVSLSELRKYVIGKAQAELLSYEKDLRNLTLPEMRSKATEYGDMVEALSTITNSDSIGADWIDSGRDTGKVSKKAWKALANSDHVLQKITNGTGWDKEEFYFSLYENLRLA